ncbi:callose synthase 5 isoform X2 [Euphorbia lathyris]|uniref:callose synthase 5 isoform X2 n=1 Tax=Euphorbia lathyris TaxID=212925 RepID=UPI0033134F13
MSSLKSGQHTVTRSPSCINAAATLSTEVFDDEDVPASLGSIRPILRVASEIEHERPRAAFLCRFYAFAKSHRLDALSIGRDVRRFKTSLLQKLARLLTLHIINSSAKLRFIEYADNIYSW